MQVTGRVLPERDACKKRFVEGQRSLLLTISLRFPLRQRSFSFLSPKNSLSVKRSINYIEVAFWLLKSQPSVKRSIFSLFGSAKSPQLQVWLLLMKSTPSFLGKYDQLLVILHVIYIFSTEASFSPYRVYCYRCSPKTITCIYWVPSFFTQFSI